MRYRLNSGEFSYEGNRTVRKTHPFAERKATILRDPQSLPLAAVTAVQSAWQVNPVAEITPHRLPQLAATGRWFRFYC